jgi:hypothetical protein
MMARHQCVLAFSRWHDNTLFVSRNFVALLPTSEKQRSFSIGKSWHDGLLSHDVSFQLGKIENAEQLHVERMFIYYCLTCRAIDSLADISTPSIGATKSHSRKSYQRVQRHYIQDLASDTLFGSVSADVVLPPP